MEISKKTIVGTVFAALVFGVMLVSASSYYGSYQLHKSMMESTNFEAMHRVMEKGDFAAAERYHESTGFACPMHELVKNGEISAEDFKTMHEWMASGKFPEEKPEKFSEAAWEIHKSHHPEFYK